ncbi:DUF4157 domain-containing protein, partial [Ekhidna sp.]|uniref:eCIS core domain-containing protein n=1 Tax=Ekhidna sp. TaxID=2608089 RepID=UPI003299EFF1
TGLPDNLKSGIENLSGHSMDDVKVHYNSSRPAQLHAHAFAQGNQIHLASGQEKHLPHEAWHVVQQKQGRVKPTMQLKSSVPVNDDPGLEKEADVMGAKARLSENSRIHNSVQHKNESGSKVIQKQNAQQAGMLGGYAPGANTNLYNARGGIGLPNGTLYTHALPAVPSANGTAGVLDAYMTATRPYAGPLAGRQFLDSPNNPQMPPSVANWGGGGANYITTLENWLQAPVNTLNAMVPPGGTRAGAIAFQNTLAANRNALRNTAAYGLIDPFISQLTIPVVGAAAPWIIRTNFSHASFGYIIDIDIGPHNVHGQIAASVPAFTAISGAVPGVAAPHVYSPGHDTTNLNTVGQQIGTVAGGSTHGANHIGLDAVTKLAAEGARFEPVRQLGTNLKINSIFFATSHSDNQVKYLDFQTLYQRWGTWFGRAYSITSAAVKAQVLAHGHVLNRPLDLPSDYDTGAGAPAHAEVGNYTTAITHYIQAINHAKQKKINYAKGKGPKKQHAVAAYNRGRNQEIEMAKYWLRPYNVMVPHLVHAVRHPAPPPVAIVPVVVPPVAVPVGVGAGVAPPPANNHTMRNILIGGVFFAIVAAVEVNNYLYGQNGLFYDYGKFK